MPSFEFTCRQCSKEFDQLLRRTDPEYGKCPYCGKNGAERRVSLFGVKGRGDLRESTWDGCHGPADHHQEPEEST